jgi:hypothetical protein
MPLKQVRKRYFARILFPLLIIVLIKIFATNSFWVEKYYATGLFPWIANLLRVLTGWLPVSLGDIFYFLVGVWLLYKIIRFVVSLFTKQYKRNLWLDGLTKIFFTAMIVYIVFNILWGLNYNRKGITYQLNLKRTEYDTTDLKNIEQLLLEKVNQRKQALIINHESNPGNKVLFTRAYNCYKQSETLYPFLKYNYTSVKSSLYGELGNYLGFTGYYNPFSGEAQLNTTVPRFLLPYTTCHEMAHQLGYAREDEANFAGYLSATSSADTLFHYSTYLDLFLYANRELYFIDSNYAKGVYQQLTPPVKEDLKELKKFLLRHRNPVEPYITWLYGKYLKANQQPEGMRTYNEVIADLIAFYKKTGRI